MEAALKLLDQCGLVSCLEFLPNWKKRTRTRALIPMRFHVGQKVICINDRPAKGENSGKGPEIIIKAGRVYTVRKVLPGIEHGYAEDGLLLAEIVNIPRAYRGPLGPVTCELFFRAGQLFPVQTTGIDQFLEMLAAGSKSDGACGVHVLS